MRRTKIVATLGPATHNPEILDGLISVGADVLRLNFSHGTRDEHARLVAMARKAAERAGREVGLLGDIPGPKLRLGDIDGDVMHLRNGQELTLTTTRRARRRDAIPVAWQGLPERGAARRRDLPRRRLDPAARARHGRERGAHAGRDRRHRRLAPGHEPAGRRGAFPSAVGEADLDWVDFAVEHGVDLLAVSFVRHASDLDPVHARLAERGADIPVIAKIEKREAAENAEEIVQAAAGGIMVARGDLGIELPIEEIPQIQKHLLSARRALLEAVHHGHADARLDGALDAPDARRGDRRRQRGLRRHRRADALGGDRDRAAPGRGGAHDGRGSPRQPSVTFPTTNGCARRTRHTEHDVADTVSYGAVVAAYQLDLAALVVPTRSGRTAAARVRPPATGAGARALGAARDGAPAATCCSASPRRTTTSPRPSTSCSRDAPSGRATWASPDSGDLIGITAGLAGQGLGTNLLEVHRVP